MLSIPSDGYHSTDVARVEDGLRNMLRDYLVKNFEEQAFVACPQCDKLFVNAHYLKQHLTRRHPLIFCNELSYVKTSTKECLPSILDSQDQQTRWVQLFSEIGNISGKLEELKDQVESVYATPNEPQFNDEQLTLSDAQLDTAAIKDQILELKQLLEKDNENLPNGAGNSGNPIQESIVSQFKEPIPDQHKYLHPNVAQPGRSSSCFDARHELMSRLQEYGVEKDMAGISMEQLLPVRNRYAEHRLRLQYDNADFIAIRSEMEQRVYEICNKTRHALCLQPKPPRKPPPQLPYSPSIEIEETSFDQPYEYPCPSPDLESVDLFSEQSRALKTPDSHIYEIPIHAQNRKGFGKSPVPNDTPATSSKKSGSPQILDASSLASSELHFRIAPMSLQKQVIKPVSYTKIWKPEEARSIIEIPVESLKNSKPRNFPRIEMSAALPNEASDSQPSGSFRQHSGSVKSSSRSRRLAKRRSFHAVTKPTNNGGADGKPTGSHENGVATEISNAKSSANRAAVVENASLSQAELKHENKVSKDASKNIVDLGAVKVGKESEMADKLLKIFDGLLSDEIPPNCRLLQRVTEISRSSENVYV